QRRNHTAIGQNH
ncbi:conjugative relaxosome accessory transposon family protein, partial [Escherichia coli EC1865]